MKTLTKFILLTIIISLSHSIQAKEILVPSEYATIQAAIDTASNGDVIVVSNGTYLENISFLGKSITVTSMYKITLNRDDIINTIIDGSSPTSPQEGSVVKFDNGENRDAILNGFTITGGTGTKTYNVNENKYFRTGGGIMINNSSPTISNNIIM